MLLGLCWSLRGQGRAGAGGRRGPSPGNGSSRQKPPQQQRQPPHCLPQWPYLRLTLPWGPFPGLTLLQQPYLRVILPQVPRPGLALPQ